MANYQIPIFTVNLFLNDIGHRFESRFSKRYQCIITFSWHALFITTPRLHRPSLVAVQGEGFLTDGKQCYVAAWRRRETGVRLRRYPWAFPFGALPVPSLAAGRRCPKKAPGLRRGLVDSACRPGLGRDNRVPLRQEKSPLREQRAS